MLKIFLFDSAFPPISSKSGAQLTTYALTLDIELVSIWILCLWASISEDLGAIEVTELNWIKHVTVTADFVTELAHSMLKSFTPQTGVTIEEENIFV